MALLDRDLLGDELLLVQHCADADRQDRQPERHTVQRRGQRVEEFTRRAKSWAPRETEYGSGAIWKYAQLVGPARYGALTNPGAKGEKEQYADI